MSSPGSFGGSGGSFEDLMRNLARMLTSQGPVNWEIARQMAQWAATGGGPEANPDPVARVRLEELARVAEMHAGEATGLPVSTRGLLSVRAITPRQWALETLDGWSPLLERLAKSVSSALPPGTPGAEAGEEAEGGGGIEGVVGPAVFGLGGAAGSDPMAQLFGNLPQVISPLLFGMQAGSMVGQLAQRAMGWYDLVMPRPPADELVLVPSAIDGFAADWSLAPDDVRLWVCLREAVHHAVLGRDHVRTRLDELIGAYVDAFQPNPRALEDRLGAIDPTDMAALQEAFGDPETLLGEMQSDEQRRRQVPLRCLLAALAGYVDHVMDRVGRRLIGSYGPLTEALRRRRLEDSGGTRILGRLFGVVLDAASYEEGQAFVRGVVERAGEDALGRLWRSPRELPTPAELRAPGLWLARIDLPGPESGPADDG